MFVPVRLGLALALAFAPAWGLALTFDQAQALAESQAPTLAAVRGRIEAARHEVTPAGELPDPRLAVGVENLPISGNDRFRVTREPMTMQRLQLTQEVPNHDKREARVALARARVDRAQAEGAAATLLLRRETALAWIRRHTVEQQLVRLGALFEENRLFDAAVRARFAGAGAVDVVMPRQEAAMLAERRDELRMQRAQAIAALERWVGPPAAEPLAGEVPSWPLDRATLLHRLHGHPDLRAADSMAGELDAQLREAQAMKQPDWGVEVAYQRRGREFGDMVSVMLMVELPVFADRRQDPRIAARVAERAGIEAEREARAREHAAMLDADLAEVERLDRAIARQYDVVRPLADERIELAMAAYRGGQGSLLDAIAARRDRVEAELKAIALEGERRTVAARLHYAYGENRSIEGGAR